MNLRLLSFLAKTALRKIFVEFSLKNLYRCAQARLISYFKEINFFIKDRLIQKIKYIILPE